MPEMEVEPETIKIKIDEISEALMSLANFKNFMTPENYAEARKKLLDKLNV